MSLSLGRSFFLHVVYLESNLFIVLHPIIHIIFDRKTTMVLRIPVTLHSVPEKFLIVCENGNETIRWLCENAYKRYMEIYKDQTIPFYLVARRTVDRSVLPMKGRVKEVLKDNEPIEIGRVKNEIENE